MSELSQLHSRIMQFHIDCMTVTRDMINIEENITNYLVGYDILKVTVELNRIIITSKLKIPKKQLIKLCDGICYKLGNVREDKIGNTFVNYYELQTIHGDEE